ncbi:MAG: DUF6263 family protein [Planctomycetaceae bacterium]
MSKFDVEQQGAQTEFGYQTTSWKRYTVKDVAADGSATLELKIDRVIMSAKGESGDFEFDSAKPGTAPAEFTHIRDTVGPPIAEIIVSAVGEVTAVQHLLKNQQNVKDADDRNVDVLSLLPNEPVKVGAQWKEKYEEQISVPPALKKTIKMQKVYTLKEVKDGLATIEMVTMVLTPLQDSKEESQLIQRTPSSIIQFHLEDGRIMSRSSSLHNTVVGFAGESSRIKVDRTCDERTLKEGDDGIVEVAVEPQSVPR